MKMNILLTGVITDKFTSLTFWENKATAECPYGLTFLKMLPFMEVGQSMFALFMCS